MLECNSKKKLLNRNLAAFINECGVYLTSPISFLTSGAITISITPQITA
jgi:hypothetical protein